MSLVFSPISCGPLQLANRIVVSPMCQYSAVEGRPSAWHVQHLMTLAMSGASLVTLEATAVSPEGRITPMDLGLYTDEQEQALGEVLGLMRSVAPPQTKFSLQLSHAGRKASANVPWMGGAWLAPLDGAWETVAPSALPFGGDWPVPRALDEDGVAAVIRDFARAAKRADQIGFDAIDLHFAHGYLVHQFLSPLANRREDRWGGDSFGRMRLALEIAIAVRRAVPSRLLLSARLSGSDWLEPHETSEPAVNLAAALKAEGIGMVCLSSGGLAPHARVRAGPFYQVPFARVVKQATGLPTQAVGLISDVQQAEAILARGDADLVALGRAFLDDPRWVWQAARRHNADVVVPPQYAKVAPGAWVRPS